VTSRSQIKLAIFWLYLGFVILNFTLILFACYRFWILPDHLMEFSVQIGLVWGPPLAIIVNGLMKNSGSLGAQSPGSAPLALISLLALWNLLMSVPFIYLVMRAGPQGMNIPWCYDWWQRVTNVLGFLSALPIGYYFLNSNQTTDRR
jgi:hypothetical protein